MTDSTYEADDTGSTTVAGETAEETREEWTEFEFEGDAKLSVEDLNVWYG
ncbi:phosphate ABC transporter ATP-binding protein, partial [Halorubellus litoreus]